MNKSGLFWFFIVLVVLAACNSKNETKVNDAENIDITEDMGITENDLSILDNIIERRELWDLSQSELRILRNTIYAKYGYIFQSVDLQIYFRQFAWYSAVNTNVDNYLSEIDKENIFRIQQREKSFEDLLAYQEKILSWIELKDISHNTSKITMSGIILYQNPSLFPETPERLTYPVEIEDGFFDYRTTAFCFAAGRFLSPAESDRIKQINNYDNLNNAIIFNPSVLFLSERIFGRVYSPFQEAGVYLIVFPKDSSSSYYIQSSQVLSDSAKNFLILPWSVRYYVYKITDDGQLMLVDEVAAN